METNWVKSQLHPEILLPTTSSLLCDMTSRKKHIGAVSTPGTEIIDS